jgi:hypothetical protein
VYVLIAYTINKYAVTNTKTKTPKKVIRSNLRINIPDAVKKDIANAVKNDNCWGDKFLL